ncbi:MAG: hypothetical protein JO023_01100 [Chloroflexi bacterium]|nr:hypothetical protein [Chloroflexota bacterium]
MELLIATLLLIALGTLAQRYGADSRDHLVAPEEHLAALGFRWGQLACVTLGRGSDTPPGNSYCA